MEGRLVSKLRNAVRFKLAYPAIERFVARRSLTRSELRARCEARDAIWYGPEEPSIEIAPPDQAVLRRAFGGYPTSFTPDRPFVCALEDCYLLDEFGTALSEDDELVVESLDWGLREFVVMERYRRSRNEFLRRSLRGNPYPETTVDASVFPLVSSDSSYYHWVVEYLPKLRSLARYEDRTGDEPLVLLESDPSGFVEDTVTYAGIERSRIRYVDEFEGTRVKRLVVPTRRPHLLNHNNPGLSTYRPSRSDLEWLRDEMVSRSDRSDRNRPSKIYVSRQQSSRGRSVRNYDRLREEIEARGFVPYVLEEHSFAEQVRIFSAADVILGPHGAGLVNMVFSDDPTVVELFPVAEENPNQYLKPYFYNLARIVGFDYEAVLAAEDGGDVIVDASELGARLDEIEAREVGA